MANRVVHFEIPADDPERAKAFYEAVFGWKITKWEGPQDYWLASTGEGPGIDGAIAPRAQGLEHTTDTIGVDDLDSAINKVQEAGGTVVMPRMTIPGIGYLAYARDTEQNIFGLMQRDSTAS